MMDEEKTGDAPSDPVEAGPPRTPGPTKIYRGEGISVIWDATRCIHVGTCTHVLPEVFDTAARPWVNVEGAPAEEVAEAVRRCPTGALRYESAGELPEEEPEDPTVVEVRPNGPLYIRGRVRVQAPGGKLITEESRVALCRCGRSENPPFCDNSHRLPLPNA